MIHLLSNSFRQIHPFEHFLESRIVAKIIEQHRNLQAGQGVSVFLESVVEKYEGLILVVQPCMDGDTRLQFHPAQQIGIARIVAEAVKMGPPCNGRQLAAALLKILLEPDKGLIFISETGIHSR